ncbi:unnamed protein product [Linum trigynum]|uniref:Toprim domain-containing protein n=1 Tax=Linum trigynum TaxID=586398 RepID=A0AAV2FXQ4_9ROSI
MAPIAVASRWLPLFRLPIVWCSSPAGGLRSRNGFLRPRYSTASLPLVLSGSEVGTLEVRHKSRMLKKKIEFLGIKTDDSCVAGLFTHLLCPKCKGGKSMESCLSFHIIQDGEFAMWRCFRPSCGWAGQAFANHRETMEGMNLMLKVESSDKLTAEGIGLEPLGDKLVLYFNERRISEGTLRRNAVMQTSQAVIAFTYRKGGELVGCKYRTIDKRFWQESGTEKWLYGLDDITEATEIIIVEGEIDKLSLEEAGFRNCVSVPAGAPITVSSKDLPSAEKDRAFQYIWNCKEYLDKFSRIILATDGDSSGQALAEELARRLGKERCWLVRWPRNGDSDVFKDANEVLRCLGPQALREAIETADTYHTDTLG